MQRTRISRRMVALVLGWAGSSLASLAASGQEPKPTPRPPAEAPKVQKALDPTDPLVIAIIEAHNKLRADEKLPPLTFAPLLAQAAQVQASDMAEHEEMTHRGSDGSTPSERIKRTGYRFLTSGENVAVFYPDVPIVMQAWVDSPPHKKNILGDFTELGVARVEDKNGKPYWCVDFGKPMPQFDPAQATTAFVTKLNEARTEAKHPKLDVDTKLATAAQTQAADSAKTNGKGGTPTQFTGLDTSKYNELAMSTAVGAPTAEAVLKMFLDNPSYKERLLGPSTKVGVGYATDSEGVPYWCLILARPVRR